MTNDQSQSDQQVKHYNAQEVAKHNKLNDNWIVVDGKVYDISSWAKKHPGGTMTLLGSAGKDATDLIDLFHGKIVRSYLPTYYIGEYDASDKNFTLQQQKDNEFLKDFRDLNKQLKKDGIYKIRYSYQIVKTVINLLFWAITWAFFVYGYKYESAILQLIGAAMLAIFFQQIAFMGHDSGHNLVSHNRNFDSLYGVLVGNFFTGISMAWWKDSHNCHHVVPNLIQYDPDIQHLPFMSLTNKYFKSLYSFYHERVLIFDRLGQWAVSHQDILFYPVMGFARYFLYVQSWIMVLGFSARRPEWQKLEFLTLVGWISWMSYMLSFCLSWKLVFGCIFLSHFLAGILHIQITLSHFTMELIDGNDIYKPDQPEESLIEVQMRTTQDITCPTYMDWFHGGLQYQLEHHLFPRVPRHNLRKLRHEYLVPLLKKHNKPILSMDFISANKYLIKLLQKVANEAKAGKFVKKSDSLIWEGINMRG